MIYIVDDDRSIRELIAYTLRNTGFEAEGFESGKEMFAAIPSSQATPMQVEPQKKAEVPKF